MKRHLYGPCYDYVIRCWHNVVGGIEINSLYSIEELEKVPIKLILLV